MKILRGLLVVVLLGFLGALVSHPALSGMMTDGKPGYLTGVDGHSASGHVEISRDRQGGSVLTIHDADIDRVPDGRIYLARNFDHRNGLEVATLHEFSGTLTFALPSSVDVNDYDSVVIWCKRFDVGIGQAPLADHMHMK